MKKIVKLEESDLKTSSEISPISNFSLNFFNYNRNLSFIVDIICATYLYEPTLSLIFDIPEAMQFFIAVMTNINVITTSIKRLFTIWTKYTVYSNI